MRSRSLPDVPACWGPVQLFNVDQWQKAGYLAYLLVQTTRVCVTSTRGNATPGLWSSFQLRTPLKTDPSSSLFFVVSGFVAIHACMQNASVLAPQYMTPLTAVTARMNSSMRLSNSSRVLCRFSAGSGMWPFETVNPSSNGALPSPSE